MTGRAGRGMRLSAAGLCALALAAPAAGEGSAGPPHRDVLVYELSAAGFGAADFTITADFQNGWYYIAATGRTFGAVDLVESLVVNAAAQGQYGDAGLTPRMFRTDNMLNGESRGTRVAWTGGEAVAQSVVPSPEAEERTPIPDAARQNALDPISALLSFSLGGPAGGTCAGRADVFDGRRSYTLVLDAEGGAGGQDELSVGGTPISALKCRITSIRTGGKSPDSMFSSGSAQEHALIWFWRDAKGRAIPVRLEAEAPIGHGIAELAALP